jgi:hypothetical protein
MEPREETESSRPGLGAALLAFAVFALVAGVSVVVARREGVGIEAGWPKGSIRESADGSKIEMVSAMRRADYRSEARALRKGEMVTIAGNGTLDLTGARMAGASSELEVVVIAGRALVKVPPEWAVVTKDSFAVGAVRNHARRAEGDPEKTLRLEAVVLGGALEVTH